MLSSGTLKLKETDAAYFLCKTALFAFFFGDACNKILLFMHFNFHRTSIFFRSFYELLFLALILVFINEVRLLFVKIFIFLFVLFFIGQFLIMQKARYDYGLTENIFVFNKYVFIFIIYFAIYKLVNFPNKFLNIIKWMEFLFLFNSAIVILSFIFQIKIFRTYMTSYRYGYDGLIPAQNEATLFYFIALMHFYYNHFILQLKSNKFFIVLIAAALLGTKGIYLCLALLLIFHFLYHTSLNTKFRTLIVITLLFFIGSWFLKTKISNELLAYFVSKSNKIGWFSMLLSGRDSLAFTRGLAILEDWSLINYFVGGQDQNLASIEMDFFDLFFFMGAIGSIVYATLYFSTMFRINVLRPFNFFFATSFLSLAFFAGHVFGSAINALYLCLMCMYLYFTQKKEYVIENNLLKPIA